MKLRLAIAIALWAAAPAHASPVNVDTPPDVGGPGALGIVKSPDGRSYAVVATVSREEMKVSAYVVYYTFAVDATGAAVTVRGGGHSYMENLIEKFGPGPRPSRWFVAELDAATQRQVVSLVEAPDRAAARKLLPELAATGLPFASVELSGARHDAVVAGRIRERTMRATTTVLTVDPVAGGPAITLSVPDRVRAGSSGIWHHHTWTGDHVVVGLAKGSPVRYLAAHDLADALRWELAVTKRGWPPAWIHGGGVGDRDVARWATSGTVKASASCGLEVVFATSSGTSLHMLEPLRVAAPPKVAAGAKLAVVVAPNPKDACGRTAHIVRAYTAPDHAWLVEGKPAPSAPLVE